MFVQKKVTPLPGETWAFDNGAYIWWRKGEPFNGKVFEKRIIQAMPQGVPYLAVTPDIPAQGKKSLEFSLSWIKNLPPEWPWYLAVQDGMGLPEVERVIDLFQGLFLGGSNRFKQTAWYWKNLTEKYHKKFHYGRAGVRKKIIHASQIGANSLDSAWPLWTKERQLVTVEILKTACNHKSLFPVRETAISPDKWDLFEPDRETKIKEQEFNKRLNLIK